MVCYHILIGNIVVFLPFNKKSMGFNSNISFAVLIILFSFQGAFQLFTFVKGWWAKVDSNHRPHDYQSCALTS